MKHPDYLLTSNFFDYCLNSIVENKKDVYTLKFFPVANIGALVVNFNENKNHVHCPKKNLILQGGHYSVHVYFW